MNVLGCFKLVPDLDMLSKEDWEEDCIPDMRYTRQIYSCFDESVLELILRMKDRRKEKVKATAITVSCNSKYFAFNTLYAVGFDEVVKVVNKTEEKHVSEIIERYICGLQNVDCVVMGEQSSDYNGNRVHYELASLLGWPCISNVCTFEYIDENTIRVMSRDERKTIDQKISTPCILIVGNVPQTYLRIPTLKQKIEMKKCVVNELEIAENEDNSNIAQIEIESVTKIDRNRVSLPLKEEEFTDYMNVLLEKSI